VRPSTANAEAAKRDAREAFLGPFDGAPVDESDELGEFGVVVMVDE
jgi:hypothetical protein